jgi:hypothetical protein
MRPFAPVLARVFEAECLLKTAAQVFAAEPMTVPPEIIERTAEVRDQLNQLVAEIEAMRVHSPVGWCVWCGDRFKIVAHDEMHETWTGRCYSCATRVTLAASGEILDEAHEVPDDRPPGAYVYLPERWSP